MSFDYLNLLNALVSPLAYPLSPDQRIYWGYMVTAFLPVAYFAWKQNGKKWDANKVREICFPKAIWTHPSNIVDIKFFLINTALFTALAAPFFGGLLGSTHVTHQLLDSLFGAMPEEFNYTVLAAIGVTILLALLGDFAIFLTHYLQHKIPFLWEFHKVHHSALVMTPITVYRMHPVDDILAYLLGGLLMGIGLGAAEYFFVQEPGIMLVAGMNIITFIFYLLFYNLRHSHFWLHYPGKLGYFFVSPAMHQIHHSSEKRHWDKNMGFIFSFWDGWFGTLYVPKAKEQFALGIGEESAEYNSVSRLYLLPFLKNWHRLQNRVQKRLYEKTNTAASAVALQSSRSGE